MGIPLPIQLVAGFALFLLVAGFILERVFGDSDEWPRDWWKKLWRKP